MFLPTDPPSEPRNLQINKVNKDFVILSWEHPSSDGGSPITGYYIEKKERNSILWVKANESVVKATQYTCPGLIEGLEYTFRVSALNLAGQSKPSKQTDFITARTDVGKDTVVMVSAQHYFKNITLRLILTRVSVHNLLRIVDEAPQKIQSRGNIVLQGGL